MKNTNLEKTILKTLRSGIKSIDQLTQELKNQEVEKKYKFRKNPIQEGEKIEKRTN